MRSMEGYGIKEVKCSRCGKIYIEQPERIFKKKTKHFCGWNCYNAHLNEIEAKKKGGCR